MKSRQVLAAVVLPAMLFIPQGIAAQGMPEIPVITQPMGLTVYSLPVSPAIYWRVYPNGVTIDSFYVQLASDAAYTSLACSIVQPLHGSLIGPYFYDTCTTVSGLTCNTLYYCRVGARYSGGVVWSVNDVRIATGPALPVIVTQPADQTVTAGQTATFSFSATTENTDQVQYSWYKNGTLYSLTASGNYTTAATTMADSGATFYCRMCSYNKWSSTWFCGVNTDTVVLNVNRTARDAGHDPAAAFGFSLSFQPASGRLAYSIPCLSHAPAVRVRIRIFDLKGACIAAPINNVMIGPGRYSTALPGNFASSVSLCVMDAGGYHRTIKINRGN